MQKIIPHTMYQCKRNKKIINTNICQLNISYTVTTCMDTQSVNLTLAQEEAVEETQEHVEGTV